MNKLIFVFFFSALSVAYAQTPWQSALVSVDDNGDLAYHPDEDDYIIPDFSHAGYKGGGIVLPNVAVVHEISPVSGDNTDHIQDAINYVGSLPLNSDGIRGALLLKAGIYDVYKTLYVLKDGIVLRGEGQGDDSSNSSIIYARENSPGQRDVILLGSNTRISGAGEVFGTSSPITDEVVPLGSFTFNVEDPSLYSVGDRIIIYHPATQAWCDLVDGGGVPFPDPSAPDNPDERWVEGQLPIIYNRFIEDIDGTQITIDAPVFYSLVKSTSECYIYIPNMNGLVSQVGLENLRIDIETAGSTDEDHAWQAARFKSVENSWAKNCTFVHFGQSGIITEACYRSTFTACSAIDPHAIITGERMYNFNTYHYSQLNLFSDCYARNGRHHYISNGTSTASGNVFLRCTSDAANSVNEGHRQWTQGMLYDNHKDINMKRDFVLGLYNRVAKGTGHGWAAVHSVLWNCDVNESYGEIGLQKPPTGQNYAIGCFAKSITGNPISETNFTRGYVEGQNEEGLEPASLYMAQLIQRVGPVSVPQSLPSLFMEVYPTLVDDVLQVRFNQNFDEKIIRVRSLTGALITEVRTSESSVLIHSWSLSSGMYLLECHVGSQLSCSKFIKN